mmetsp:Transcript_53784/g.125095  ORF Transcript_53784/g.125095 Transcript_53784/m.125095 type:complete len:341 (-) Transcript_53784:195-1217(-)
MFFQALAPVLRALGGQQQATREVESAPNSKRAKHPGQMPEVEYPVPLLVKNTFIDAPIQRPCSLEGFFKEREVRSTPASRIEMTAALDEVPAPAFTKVRLGRSAEADGSSSCRSTSVGSSSGHSCTEDSPSGFSEASSETRLEENNRVQADESRSCGSRLPEFDYPEPLFVKNTFIHLNFGRSLSLEDFVEERLLQSCPGSLVHQPLEMPSTPENALTPALFADSSAEIPPPPAAKPSVLFLEPKQTVAPPAVEPTLPPMQDSAVVLRLSLAVAPGTVALPSVGSSEHCLGTCKPCAHFHSVKGCKNGTDCSFCHLCPPGELKRQQRAKRLAQRRAIGRP